MNLILYKTLAAILVFFVSLLTSLYPLKKTRQEGYGETSHLGEALASGIFLGAAFFHMLPDAIRSFAAYYPLETFPVPELVCVSGFLFLLFLERLSFAKSSVISVPYVLAFTLMIHALIEGLALGMGPSLTETLMLFIAIMAHKGSESFALCVLLLQHHLNLKRILFIVIVFSLLTPLGICLGTWLDIISLGSRGVIIASMFNAFAAGSFLYISTIHHVHFHNHARGIRSMMEFASLFLGTTIMGVIAIWV
ncbi:MAG: ZIP family metal transporter [Gammaproteobacteria bacterium]|nr:ZIP family metal transporter [Gammaproteobacteria bacterium]